MMTLSGLSTPRRSASSIMASPMRSLMLPPGLARSSFIHTSTRAREEAVEPHVRGVADGLENGVGAHAAPRQSVLDVELQQVVAPLGAARGGRPCASWVTTEPGGTLCVSQTLPPMTLPAPMTVSPPRMVALA